MFETPGIGRQRYMPRLKPHYGWPALIALIDIFFLMLLFFVLSRSFVRVSGISVELPRSKAPNVAALERFIVSITPPSEPGRPCTIYYQDKPVKSEELLEHLSKLRDANRQSAVIIRADRRVPFDVVAGVMAIAEAAELSSFIAVTPPGENPETRFE